MVVEIDTLEFMFKHQKEFQLSMGQQINTHEYAKNMILAASDELHEILHTFSWKPWSKKNFFNRDEYVKEYIDLLHFVVNIGLVANITQEEVLSEFIKKHEINKKRQKDGY